MTEEDRKRSFKEANAKLAHKLQEVIQYGQSGKLTEAYKICSDLCKKFPDNDQVMHLMGLIHLQSQQLTDALDYFQRAIKLYSHNPLYFNHSGVAYCGMGDYANGIKCYQHALILEPNSAHSHYNLAIALAKENQYAEAEIHYAKAIELNPDLQELQKRQKNSKLQLNDYKQQIITYKNQLAENQNSIELLEKIIKTKRACCDWQDLDKYIERLKHAANAKIAKDEYIQPFNFLALGWSTKEQYAVAKNIASFHFRKLLYLRQKLKFEFDSRKASNISYINNRKIRLGYVSGDIRNHATAHLMKNMLSYHNKDEFEVYLYSIGPDDGSCYAKEIPKQCDCFRNLFNLSFEECARQIYSDRIDIAIDMMGYTQYSRTQIFELKPAPLQISFLAYPGTMGTDFIDYLVADRIVIPKEESNYYTEKIIYMPNTYFVTDNQQPIAQDKITHHDCGLPENSFVLCCFNRVYKLEPLVFDIWMHILKEVPDAVLWLYTDIPAAQHNLLEEAKRRGVSEQRIIFATTLPKDKHLNRQQLADLFLDCFSLNAHTTAIDALWANVPVITYLGNSIISRASSSILNSIGLPELITNSADEYKEKILYYAKNRDKLNVLKQRIINYKRDKPLFNTQQYVKDLENGFKQIWNKWLIEEKAENIYLGVNSTYMGNICSKNDQ